jgi:hypothetical protein
MLELHRSALTAHAPAVTSLTALMREDATTCMPPYSL